MSKRILVVSLPKTGTHLIKQILGHAGLEAVDLAEPCKVEHFAELEAGAFYFPHAKYILSHFPPTVDVYGLIEAKTVRAIFQFRDPRDTCVSRFRWNHPNNKKVTTFAREYMKQVYRHAYADDDAFLRGLITEDRFGTEEFVVPETFRLARPLLFHPYVHKTRFEDLVGNAGGGSDETQLRTVSALLEFLEVEADPEKVAAAAFSEKSRTFDRGQIGSYKEVFSPEHVELFERLHGSTLDQYGYKRDLGGTSR